MRIFVTLVLVYAILLAIGYLLRREKAAKAVKTDLNGQMAVVANEAVELARTKYRVNLDYSSESIKRLEENILAKLHEQQLKTPASEADLNAAAVVWGAYIGETLRRKRPGQWDQNTPMGAGVLAVVHDGQNMSFPCAWVYKRIVDGEADNVWSKFDITTRWEELSRQPATVVVVPEKKPPQ